VYGCEGVSWRVFRNCRSNGSLSALEKVDEVQSDRRVPVEHSWEVVESRAAMCKAPKICRFHVLQLHFTFEELGISTSHEYYFFVIMSTRGVNIARLNCFHGKVAFLTLPIGGASILELGFVIYISKVMIIVVVQLSSHSPVKPQFLLVLLVSIGCSLVEPKDVPRALPWLSFLCCCCAGESSVS
jgi:hypothetical protein